MAEERLQKIMAAAGIGSRRACEKLIEAGLVQVGGQTVTKLGTKVDPRVSAITVDGHPLTQPNRNIYIKLHKPRGILSDIGGDARGRQSVADLLPQEFRRVFPVGRLDLNSEGLMLLTDDGGLAHKLTHPRYQHPKTYFVLVEKRPSTAELRQLQQGVLLPDGYRTAPVRVQVMEQLPSLLRLESGRTNGIWLRMTLHEGKKRQIRHMTAAVGHPTLRLVRWSIGPLLLDDLKAGKSKPLTRDEVSELTRLEQYSVQNDKKKSSEKPQRGQARSHKRNEYQTKRRRSRSGR